MMKKFILIIISVIFLSFLGLLLWMNLTPGYFQYRGCGCDEVGYFTDEEVLNSKPNPTCRYVDVICRPSLFNKFLVFLSRLDFNKGKMLGEKVLPFEDKLPLPGYVCPKKNYINCMPGIVEHPNELEPGTNCSREYLNWSKANCPGFKGPAY